MPTSVRRAARTCAIASLLALGTAVPAAAAAGSARAPVAVAARVQSITTASVAAAGAGWIARDFSPSGALVDAGSHQPSAGDTANAILALVAAGYGADQVSTATNWLEHHFASYVSTAGVDNPGRLANVILAAVAAGANPDRFGGSSKSNNLVARLEATEHLTGASAGAFGSGSSANAFFQALSLLALVAVKDTGRGVRLGETYLASLQCSDGGWEYARTSPSVACATPSPKNYVSPDTNTTSLAVQAIVAAGGHLSHSALSFFKNSEETNGSFGLYGVSGDGQVGDPNSTGYVIQALIALRALNDTEFVRGGTTPETALARFQLGCKAPADERGEFSAFGAPSQLATIQAVPAAAGVAFPVPHRKLSVAEPRLSCGAG